MVSSKISAEDLRAAVSRSGVHGYVIAGRARINPVRLSRILRGHVRITDDIAARILLAIEQEVANGR